MQAGLRGRDLITLHDYNKEEIWEILNTARYLKRMAKVNNLPKLLDGKAIALVFENKSTRTRASFEIGVARLGGYPMYIWSETAQTSRGEPVKDAVRVWDRYVDGIVLRALEPNKGNYRILEYAHYADVPVINASTDLHHPCQALADLLTIWEKKGRLDGLKLAYTGMIGSGGGTINEFAIVGPKLGMDIIMAVPAKYSDWDPQVKEWAEQNAQRSGKHVEIVNDIYQAVEGADIVYTDEIASTGFFHEREQRVKDYESFTVTNDVMRHARPDAIYMHCLPATRGEEVSEDVLEGAQSVIWDEAENRLHVQNAVMALLF